MKKMTLLLALSTLALPAFSAVPNTFTAGTPAKAAEVNANFTYLDSRIDGAAGCDDNFGAPTWTYSATSVSPGSTVNYTFNSVQRTYTQTRSVFVDPVSGTRYAISFPMDDYHFGDVYIRKAQGGCFNDLTISGYPAEFQFHEYYNVWTGAIKSSVDKSLTLQYIDIKVGNLVVRFMPNYLQASTYTEYSISNYDSVGYVPDAEFTTRLMSQFSFMDNWIDRVKIEVLP